MMPFGGRFLWRVYAGFGALILLFSLLVGLLVDARVKRLALEQIDEALRARCLFLRELALPYLTEESADRLQDDVRRLGAELQTRLTVIRADGQVLADSDEAPALMDNHSGRTEVALAKSGGVGASTRFSHTISEPMRYLALAMDGDGQPRGYVRAALPLNRVNAELQQVRTGVIFGTGIAALIALALGYVVARALTNPLTGLTRRAEEIAQGRYESPRRMERQDEVGHLERAMESMALQVQRQIRTIENDHNQLRAILEGMVEGVIAVDRQERVVHMNSAAARMLNTRPGESIGRPIWEIARMSALAEAVSRSMAESREISREIQRADELKDRAVRILAAPLASADGDAAGAVVVLHDVSELRRLEQVRKDFVANVSHELKTPLTAIRGFIETVLDDPEMDPATQQRFLERVRDQTTRLSTLVTDLLTLSRVESDGGFVARKPIDLCETARDAVRSYHYLSEEKGLTLEAEIPDEPLYIQGDPEAMRDVINNLLDNAVKYTPAGGRIWARLSRRNGRAAIEIQDTGIGIEPKDQQRIFERFYRVDKARSRELGGTGLGLSIVKNVASALGGEVTVESASGQGATFRVFLPLTAPPESKPDAFADGP